MELCLANVSAQDQCCSAAVPACTTSPQDILCNRYTCHLQAGLLVWMSVNCEHWLITNKHRIPVAQEVGIEQSNRKTEDLFLLEQKVIKESSLCKLQMLTGLEDQARNHAHSSGVLSFWVMGTAPQWQDAGYLPSCRCKKCHCLAAENPSVEGPRSVCKCDMRNAGNPPGWWRQQLFHLAMHPLHARNTSIAAAMVFLRRISAAPRCGQEL